MGASYPWSFLESAYWGLQSEYPRVPLLACKLLGIVPADVLKAWRKDPRSWVRFKKMVHFLQRYVVEFGSWDAVIEHVVADRARIESEWHSRDILAQSKVLDVGGILCSNDRAPIERELAEGGIPDRRQLPLDLGVNDA